MTVRNEGWVAVDDRTGKQVGQSLIGFTEAQAEATIQDWRDRDARGGRPDLRALIPHLQPKQLADTEPS